MNGANVRFSFVACASACGSLAVVAVAVGVTSLSPLACCSLLAFGVLLIGGAFAR